MGDPYRDPRYRSTRGERYEYPQEEYDYPPYGGRGAGGPPPPDIGFDRTQYREYERPSAGYDPAQPPRGVPRSDYRQSRPADDYAARRGRDYNPAPLPPRGPVGEPYPESYYQGPPAPPSERHRPPPSRDTYERYPQDVYRDDRPRRRVRDDEYEIPQPYYEPPYYEPEPPVASRRTAPIEYRPAPYSDIEPPPQRSRRPREIPIKIPPSQRKPSPEDHDEEFTLPASEINKDILQRYITRFLGNDAVSRGPMMDPEIGLVYKYRAYRQFTSEQIRDLKKESERLEAYSRGRDIQMPSMPILPTSTRPTGRRGTDEELLTEAQEQYTYAVPNQRNQAIRAGRSPHDPTYTAPYHEPAQHRRPPIEASAMRQTDDDEDMED
ncbi:hypothetical protein DRE_02693 [Drechslerella stenobrocha 248]|uniref:Uncharacterized protein n=1 Tax=Drechslerella stenobrocha 248 TaxID=1043628 RepID=W7HX59_9PEZI|nr:hypothetical protein DRE_02693 [Drechslerella stenobrocha 248]